MNITVKNQTVKNQIITQDPFTQKEYQALEEIFADFLKDFPDDKMYQAIYEKAKKGAV